jgi:hypothetical protein
LECVHAGIAIFAAALSLTGPLITFHGLPRIWALAELVLLVLALMFLALTCMTDPGFLQQNACRDPLLDVLRELERKQMEQTVSITTKVQHRGVEYKRLLNGAWQRIVPGAVPLAYLMSCCDTDTGFCSMRLKRVSLDESLKIMSASLCRHMEFAVPHTEWALCFSSRDYLLHLLCKPACRTFLRKKAFADSVPFLSTTLSAL